MLTQLLNKESFTKEEITFLLALTDKSSLEELYNRADEVRKEFCGDDVLLQGIIDISNYCESNCFYCGLRNENDKVSRFRMTPEKIIESAKIISNLGMNNIVLQSGQDPDFDSDIISYIIFQIKQKAKIDVTLNLGERSFEDYRAWRIAGADRYLLKHVITTPGRFSTAENEKKSSGGIAHLKFLKSIGFEVGSVNLIGIPNQSIHNVADIISFNKELGINFISLIPYKRPIAATNGGVKPYNPNDILKAIAITRLVLKDINISATLTFDSIDLQVKEKGLTVGANVVMTNLTPNSNLEEIRSEAKSKEELEIPMNNAAILHNRIEGIGRKVSYKWSDLHNYSKRITLTTNK